MALFGGTAKKKRTAKKRKAKKKTSKKTSKSRGARRSKSRQPPREECLAVATARDSKGRFKKRRSKSKRKKRKSNPSSPPSRRRRRSSGRSYSRRRRRRNPSEPQSMVKRAWGKALDEFFPRLGGKLATSWVVMRWGNKWGPGIMGDQTDLTSPYAGAGWSLWNYILGAGTALIGGAMVGRFFGRSRGQIFAQSAFDDMLQRLFYTEVIGRSDWAKSAFGFDPIPTGYVIDGDGNRFARFDNTPYQQSMLGLVESGPMGELVEAGPLSTGRAMVEASAKPMGHLTRERVDPYFAAGAQDPYSALMMFP